MGCLALSYHEQAFPIKSGCFVFLSTAKAAQRCPQGIEKKCAGSYKFGFNGQEKVNEIAGIGNHTTALFWEYDTRIARRWNLDPVDQISISNYAVMGLNPIVNSDVLGDDFRDKKGNNVAAGDGIVATKDGSRITNTNRTGNWDYGTWNEESGSYDLHNYERTDGLSAGELLDLGRVDLWSSSSARAAGNMLRKTNAKSSGEGSYLRNIIELKENDFGEPEFYLRSIVAPVDNAPKVQVINDFDVLAFMPGGSSATGALARKGPFKGSQIVNGFQKMGKVKGSSVEKMPRQVAKELNIDYHEFSKMIHKSKKAEGRGGADNYSWDELMQMGRKLQNNK